MRLQVLIDKRKGIINEDTISQALRLDDADSIDCLPNEEIFAELARMGVGKGFSGVDTPLFDGMLVPQQVQDDVADAVENEDVANEISDEPTPPLPTPPTTPPPQQELVPLPSQTCATLTKKVGHLEQDKIAQAIKITKLKQRVRRGEIAELDITLKEVDAKKDAKVQGRLPESQAQVSHLDLKHAQKVLITTATTITAAPVPKASTPRRKRGVIIQDPKEAATASLSVQSEEKQDNAVMRYQALKRKPITEAYARKNMMVYLKNMPGFKINFFKGMSYTDIRPIFEKHFNSIWAFLEKGEKEIKEEDGKRKGKDLEQKAAKKQKIDEEVPVVDYQIYTKHNKPYYKIIRADGSHHLFLSFISLLKNFDREDLEMLWKIVQERFESLEPKNFSNDFLLNVLKTIFEKPNVEANIWKNQRGRYGLAKVKS
nr:hypothetical protein [Tanacetum cinerariifolium]